MKKLITILFLFGVAYGQTVVPRSPASIQPQDARFQATLNLIMPRYHDSTGANASKGLDYLGAQWVDTTNNIVYYRGKDLSGTKKWFAFASGAPGVAWGSITGGNPMVQTDLASLFNGKQNVITLGTSAQYFDGTLALRTFPTLVSAFTNDAGYLVTVADTNSITGNGTTASKLKLINDVTSPGINKVYGTDGSGVKGWQPAASGSGTVNSVTANAPLTGGTITTSGSIGVDTSKSAGKIATFTDVGKAYTSGAVLTDTTLKLVRINGTSDTFKIVGRNTGGAGFADPMTTAYDIIYRNGSNVTVRLAKGADGSFLGMSGGVLQYISTTTYGVNGIHFNTAGDTLKLGGSLMENTVISGHNSYTFTFDSTAIYLTGPPYTTPINSDSTNNKVLVRNISTGKVSEMYWPATGGGGGGSSNSVGRDSLVTITSGTSSTVTSGYNVVQINPSSLMANYTLTLPATWHTSNDVLIVFGGTITSGNPVVTNLTIVNGSGQTIVQANIPSSALSGNVLRYHLIGTIDYRITY